MSSVTKIAKIKALVDVVQACNDSPVTIGEMNELVYTCSEHAFKKCKKCPLSTLDPELSCMDIFYEKVRKIING